MKAKAETQNAITQAPQRFTDVYASRDLNPFLACFAPDADVPVYGTGAEKYTGLDQIRIRVERDWGKVNPLSLPLTRSPYPVRRNRLGCGRWRHPFQ